MRFFFGGVSTRGQILSRLNGNLSSDFLSTVIDVRRSKSGHVPKWSDTEPPHRSSIFWLAARPAKQDINKFHWLRVITAYTYLFAWKGYWIAALPAKGWATTCAVLITVRCLISNEPVIFSSLWIINSNLLITVRLNLSVTSESERWSMWMPAATCRFRESVWRTDGHKISRGSWQVSDFQVFESYRLNFFPLIRSDRVPKIMTRRPGRRTTVSHALYE